ncbi:MAG: SPOR domain-containing protein [bacterium]
MAAIILKSFVFAGLITSVMSGCALTGGDGMATTDPATGDAAALDGTAADDTAAVTSARSVRLVDHDVEAPKDFQTTDKALWDGRPSLGGVWVAAPSVTDPMRVIMRNPANGKFVIGALFRREADNPGPKLQISSDAADALGMIAGQPATLNITALRREEVPAAAPDATRPLLDTSETVQATTLPVATAAPTTTPATPAKPVNGAKPTTQTAAAVAAAATAAIATPPTPAAPAAGGAPIQIGIFSVEANANRAVAALKKKGIVAQVSKETSHGKDLWSVTARGDAALLAKIKAAGFKDAYILKR